MARANWYLFAVYPGVGGAAPDVHPIGMECGTIKEGESRIRWMYSGGLGRLRE